MIRSPALASAAALAAAVFAVPATAAPPLVDTARYTFEKPADGWEKPGFDASEWKEGRGGFGTAGTDGARVGTTWATDDVWLRKTVTLAAIPDRPALLVSHDEDAEVYLNGEKIAEFGGYVTEYLTRPLSQRAAGSLKVGENVLAVHCRQRDGGQFIDVHLVDADAVPDLPEPPPRTEPVKTELVTEWGAEVTPENAWTEYPRPQMRRDDWTNLNGNWEYAIAPLGAAAMPEEADGEILVPFALESKLGGVQRLLAPDESLWYRRAFDADPADGERALLHFEAVDYICEAFVNGQSVGTHVGGSTPFYFDVTDALQDGEDELIVRVEDSTGEYQLRGKQDLRPSAIFYTRVSGIWGSVWTETVPADALSRLKIDTDAGRRHDRRRRVRSRRRKIRPADPRDRQGRGRRGRAGSRPRHRRDPHRAGREALVAGLPAPIRPHRRAAGQRRERSPIPSNLMRASAPSARRRTPTGTSGSR